MKVRWKIMYAQGIKDSTLLSMPKAYRLAVPGFTKL